MSTTEAPRWDRVPAPCHVVILTQDKKVLGWIRSKHGKVWEAVQLGPITEKGQVTRLDVDGKHIGIYDDPEQAMQVVQAKVLNNV